MLAVIILLGILCVILMLYLIQMKNQLRNIKEQLHKRSMEQAGNALLIEMSHGELRKMVVEMNKVLAQEEAMRITAKAREQELKKLISDISHDLRTPLTVTKGFLQMLEKCRLGKEEKEYLSVCMEHTEELEKLLLEFFTYSYWSNEENQVSLECVNLSNIIENVMADFVPLFEKQELTMSLQSEKISKVLGEEELLRRVMGNILKNCLAYAVGEVEVIVKQQTPTKVSVCVCNHLKDSGNLDIERVFERFYTHDKARNRSSGLGLSIVKLLVEKMNGQVFAGLRDEKFEVGFICKVWSE